MEQGPIHSRQAEPLLSTRRVFDGRLVGVRVDTVRTVSGAEREREVVEHPGAVAVLPILPDGGMVLVRQYRHAVGRSLLEVPAGTREPDEDPERTGRRELEEETGYSAGAFTELVRFLVSPGWADEELIVFLATDLSAGAANPEDDESLETQVVYAPEMAGLVASGAIADSKTIISLLAYQNRSGSHFPLW